MSGDYTRVGTSVTSQIRVGVGDITQDRGLNSGGSWYVASLHSTVTADEAEQGLITLATIGFTMAMSMVGNEGQESLVTTLGLDGFFESIRFYVNNEYNEDAAVEYIKSLSEHPEAIHIILEDSVHEMVINVNAATVS